MAWTCPFTAAAPRTVSLLKSLTGSCFRTHANDKSEGAREHNKYMVQISVCDLDQNKRKRGVAWD